jgi:ATP-dependent 26S proteasome regulatory subunit
LPSPSPCKFDAVIEYGLPTPAVAEQVLRSRLALLKTSRVNWKKVLSAAAGLSHAELARACEHAAKDAILARRTTVETSELVAALMQRRSAQA